MTIAHTTIQIRVVCRAAAVVLLALVVVTLTAQPAHAHAVLTETTPRFGAVVDGQPDRVVATFNEPVEVNFGALRVFDSNGERVDDDDSGHLEGEPESIAVTLMADLPEDTYTVTYRALSADSHPVDGAFVFHIGAPGTQPEGIGEQLLEGGGGSGPVEQTLFGLARAANFAGLLLLAGAIFFALAIWQRRGSPEQRPPEVERVFGRRWRRVVVASWWTTLVASAAMFVLQGAVAADLPLLEALSPGLLGDVAGTRFGIATGFRLALLVVAAGAWWTARRSASVAPGVMGRASSPSVGAASVLPPLPTAVTVSIGVLLLALLASPGLGGHAASTSPVLLSVPADVIHMAGVAAWLGGLVVLLGVAYPASATGDGEARAGLLAPLVRRFSSVAFVAVALIVVTGTIRAWLELDALSALWEGNYGRVLLTKVGVFLPLVALGFVNKRTVARGLEGASGGGGLARVRRLIGVEIALATVVLALTAWLVGLSPASGAMPPPGEGGPYEATLEFGEARLDVLIDPAELGANTVHLTARNDDGSPLEVRSMAVDFTLEARDVGPLTAKGKELSPGHYVVEGNQLSLPGEWTIAVRGRVDKFTQVDAETKIDIGR